jgi:hypothetical protein
MGMASITKRKNLKKAFIIDEYFLKLLNIKLLQHVKEVEYKIECADGSSYSYSDVEHLLQFPNSRGRHIEELVTSSPLVINVEEKHTLPQIDDEAPTETISIVVPNMQSIQVTITFQAYPTIFWNASMTYAITYRVQGDNDRDVFYLGELIEEIVLNTRPWYSPLAYISFPALYLIVFLPYLALYWILVIVDIIDRTESSASAGMLLNFLFVIMLIYFAAEFVRNKIFPIGVFSIGDGIKRQGQLEVVRNLLFAGTILPILIGLFLKII